MQRVGPGGPILQLTPRLPHRFPWHVRFARRGHHDRLPGGFLDADVLKGEVDGFRFAFLAGRGVVEHNGRAVGDDNQGKYKDDTAYNE